MPHKEENKYDSFVWGLNNLVLASAKMRKTGGEMGLRIEEDEFVSTTSVEITSDRIYGFVSLTGQRRKFNLGRQQNTSQSHEDGCCHSRKMSK